MMCLWVKNLVSKVCLGSGKYHIMCLFGMYVVDMRHTEPRHIESPRGVRWGSGIVALDVFIMFVPLKCVLWVGATYRDAKYTCRGLVECGVICLKSRVNTICRGLVNITLCVYLACVGDMGRSEPWYVESPRDVCWGSGIVALDDLWC